MGNTGSAHNMHMENISSELNAFYHSQQLRRAGKRQQQQHQLQWTHSLPHMMGAAGVDGEMSAAAVPPATVLAQIKVLPQLSERLKLRTTTNGAILHSGGTISGRREQQLKRETEKPLAIQRRSHTFIDEPRTDYDVNLAHQVPLSAFRRAQTVLHLDYSSTYRNNVSPTGSSSNNNRRSTTSNSSAVYKKKCFSDSASEQKKHRIKAAPLRPTAAPPPLLAQSRSGAVSAQAADGVKLNKYNKIRKAPAVPLKGTTTQSAIATKNSNPAAAAKVVAPATPILKPTPNMNVTAATKAIATITKTALSDTKTATKGLLAKTRLFRTNAAKSTNIQQQPQLSPYQQSPLRQMQQQHQRSMNAITKSNVGSSKLTPYRREKSSDAILVRQFGELPNKVPTCSLNAGDTGKYKSATVPTSEAPVQASRRTEVGAAIITGTISQLNRTFYFGMDAASGKQDAAYPEVALIEPPPAIKGEISSAGIAAEAAASAAAADAISSYMSSMSPEAQAIVDNGLLVHVRPTLPRRQLDTPSFSPVSAWRMLVEKQKRLHKKTITNNNVQSTYLPVIPTGNKIDLFPYMTVCDTNHTGGGVSALKEPLIEIHKVEASTTLLFLAQRSLVAQFAASWTPQQDLEEEEEQDDDDTNNNNDNNVDNDEDNDYDDENGRGHRVDHKNHKVDLADIAIGTFSHRKCVEAHRETATTDSQKYGRTKKQIAASTKILPNRNAGPAVSRMHVFSLSLPRDGHIAAHMENRHATAAGQRKDDTCGFSSLQKLKYNDHNKYKCCCMEVSAARNHRSDTDEQVAPIVADATSQCAVHSQPTSANYRSDNWVLHKTKSTSSLAIASVARYPQHTPRKNTGPHLAATTKSTRDTLALVEPISLAYLTAGKHVMYLPGKEEHKNKGNGDGHGAHATANKRSARTANANRNRVGESMEQQQAPLKQQQQKRQRRTRPVRESLQDADSVERHRPPPGGGTSNVDKSQRFSFQSTVRLLEKCRLAEQLAKDAAIREEQRKSELEAIKRVEEDFQRKRASEKANIRNQLRLYFSGVDECSVSERQQRKPQYMSLPVFSSKQGQELLYPHNQQQPHDSNNNIACRDEPDGAASPPSSSYLDSVCDGTNQVAQSYKPLQRRHDSNCGESDLEPEVVVANFKRTASLVKPFLHPIVK